MLSYVSYAGTGALLNFTVTFPFIASSHVNVYVGGVLKTVTTDYSITGSTVTFVVAPALAAVVLLKRVTPRSTALVTFVDGPTLGQVSLNKSALQALYMIQEVYEQDLADIILTGSGDVVGPAGATDSNIAVFNTATGKLIRDGGQTLAALVSTVEARANHSGTQLMSTISNAGTAATLNVPAAGNAAAGEVVKGSDARLTDSRTPSAHATSHKSGGTDAIKLDELAAPTNVTTLNVSTTAHGLQPILPNDASKYMDGTGNYTVPPGGAVDVLQGQVFN